eukprot:CAMPEP_0194397020 /NCGR_PEP_ID=MMETSP0174-20130528/125313_1 /TAXON_ID=216777 /ORGANISM="Proboscia alata, Strain PI-D3" /LENGTH=61 /DNA_ID=CAMNT_0039193153 /DNA_START=409 /DNA_END=597 /DNA_ORIENTATION=+
MTIGHYRGINPGFAFTDAAPAGGVVGVEDGELIEEQVDLCVGESVGGEAVVEEKCLVEGGG